MLCHKEKFKFLAPIHAKWKSPPLYIWKSYILQTLGKYKTTDCSLIKVIFTNHSLQWYNQGYIKQGP